MSGAIVGPIHHVAIVVRSIERSLPRYRDLFGLEPEADAFEFPSQRVRLCFLRTGPHPSARIELIEPLGESGTARFLAERGEGLHHVCFATDDLPQTLERLAAHEAELIDRQPRPGAHGTVGFVHPRTLSGVLWELLEQRRSG
jgi:methylmalonyl-CoA/ethylmalonyl-CoA epimerase